MKKVYVLQHVSQQPPDAENVKFIGVYSSEQMAKEAIGRLKDKPGFVGAESGFSVDQYELDKDHWVEGFV